MHTWALLLREQGANIDWVNLGAREHVYQYLELDRMQYHFEHLRRHPIDGLFGSSSGTSARASSCFLFSHFCDTHQIFGFHNSSQLMNIRKHFIYIRGPASSVCLEVVVGITSTDWLVTSLSVWFQSQHNATTRPDVGVLVPGCRMSSDKPRGIKYRGSSTPSQIFARNPDIDARIVQVFDQRPGCLRGRGINDTGDSGTGFGRLSRSNRVYRWPIRRHERRK